MKTITILPSGEVQFLGECPVDLPLMNAVRRRVSTICPVRVDKRLAFRALRTVFGDEGRVAAFTRKWKGTWRATILATGQTQTFNTRARAVAWEIGVLEQ